MSVRVSERSEGKLQVLVLIRKLTEYTMNICKNDKVFPKSQRWLMSKRICDECLDALACIVKANTLRLDDHAAERKALQEEAHAHLETMLILIDVAYTVHSIPSKRIVYWGTLITDTERTLKGWMKSDRYRT